MKYKILINYSTGDSFNNYDTSDYIGMEWNNLDVCKRNIKRIAEFSNFYKDQNHYDKEMREKSLNENIKKDWYIDEHSMKLELDNSDFFQISSFWTDYFNLINSVEIVEDKTDWKIEL